MGEDEPTKVARKRPSTPRRGRAAAAEAAVTDSATPVVIEMPPSSQVAMHRSAVGRIEGDDVSIVQGAVGAVRAEHLSVDRGAVGAVLADRVEVSRGYARSILARQVQLDRGAARVVIAADVRAQGSSVMFLVARRVSGDMRVLFDWRGALAFGAAAGMVFAALSRIRKRR